MFPCTRTCSYCATVRLCQQYVLVQVTVCTRTGCNRGVGAEPCSHPAHQDEAQEDGVPGLGRPQVRLPVQGPGGHAPGRAHHAVPRHRQQHVRQSQSVTASCQF